MTSSPRAGPPPKMKGVSASLMKAQMATLRRKEIKVVMEPSEHVRPFERHEEDVRAEARAAETACHSTAQHDAA